MHELSLLNKFIQRVNKLNDKVGEWLSMLVIVMTLITFSIVILRYIFNWGWVWLQELVIYFHALLFLAGSAYALKVNGHVRVDIFYEKMSLKKKHWVNLLGSLLLLLPTCILIFYQSLPYIVDSWSVFEASPDGGGLNAVFILKSFLILFVGLLFLQGLSLIGESYLGLKKENLNE